MLDVEATHFLTESGTNKQTNKQTHTVESHDVWSFWSLTCNKIQPISAFNAPSWTFFLFLLQINFLFFFYAILTMTTIHYNYRFSWHHQDVTSTLWIETTLKNDSCRVSKICRVILIPHCNELKSLAVKSWGTLTSSCLNGCATVCCGRLLLQPLSVSLSRPSVLNCTGTAGCWQSLNLLADSIFHRRTHFAERQTDVSSPCPVCYHLIQAKLKP